MAFNRAAFITAAAIFTGWAAIAAAQTPRGDLFARYDAALDSYRAGNLAEGVRTVSAFTDDQVERISNRWFPPGQSPPIGPAQSRVARLAGMLHTDCAFALYRAGRSLPSGVTLRSDRPLAPMTADAHLLLARRLVDASEGDSSGADSFRRRWYLASLMFLHRGQRLWSPVARLRDVALRAFPNDAEILLESGAIDETWAESSPSPLVLLNDEGLDVARAQHQRYLNSAEQHLSRALGIDPGLTEALLRLARVRAESGRFDEAIGPLERIVASTASPEFRYLATLFLGRIEERRNRPDDAAARYGAALTLYPRSRTARTALAHVRARQGQRDAALALVRAALETKREDDEADPWWRYQKSEFRSFDSLFTRLRQEISP